jgi:hypothetical protein
MRSAHHSNGHYNLKLHTFTELLTASSRPALGSTQSPIKWVPGALLPGIKQPVREADHLPSASAEVKKMWIYTSTPPYAFIVTTLRFTDSHK